MNEKHITIFGDVNQDLYTQAMNDVLMMYGPLQTNNPVYMEAYSLFLLNAIAIKAD